MRASSLRKLDQLLHPVFVKAAERQAPSGLRSVCRFSLATGQIGFSTPRRAVGKDGKKVILCRIETSPEDIGGMNVAVGILTARGRPARGGGRARYGQVLRSGW